MLEGKTPRAIWDGKRLLFEDLNGFLNVGEVRVTLQNQTINKVVVEGRIVSTREEAPHVLEQ